MAGGSSRLIPTWSEIRKFHNTIVLVPLDKVAANTVNPDEAAGSVPVSRWPSDAQQLTVRLLQVERHQNGKQSMSAILTMFTF